MRYARRLAGISDADDLLADAFVRVFEVIRDGRGPEVATDGLRSVEPDAPVPVPPQGVDLAVRALTAYSAGAGRFVVEADVLTDTSAPHLTFEVGNMTAFEVRGGTDNGTGTGPTPTCTSKPSASADMMTVLCVFDGPVNGRTTLDVELDRRRLEARVGVVDAGRDDPRPGNSSARVLVDDLAR